MLGEKSWQRMLLRRMSKLGMSSHLLMRQEDTPIHWVGNLITTCGFLSFVSARAEKDNSILEPYIGYMRNCSVLALAQLELGSVEVLQVHRSLLFHCSNDGILLGFSRWLVWHNSSIIKDSLRVDWHYMQEMGWLRGDFDADAHHFADVYVFLSLFPRARRSRIARRRWSGGQIDDKRKWALQAMIDMVGKNVDAYIQGTYRNQHDTQMPPHTLCQGTKRRHVHLDPLDIWEVLVQARTSGVSIRQVVRVRQFDHHVKCGVSSSDRWINALSSMYDQRRYMVFKDHRCLCLGADASTLSIGDDCLLNVAWSWEKSAGAYGDFQFIKPTKGSQLSNQEIDMYDDIAVLVASGKAERMATYRQIQATSHAIAQLTHHERTLDSYVLPANVHARPVRQNEFRAVVRHEASGLDEAVFVDRDTHLMEAAMPLEFDDVYQLILCEDQGPQCTAMAGFTKQDHKKMILYKWDPLHRDVRDIKAVYSAACGGRLSKHKFLQLIFGL